MVIFSKNGFSISNTIFDTSTLCKRTKTLPVVIRVRQIRNKPIHIVVDGSGIKVYGEGEWKVRKHGWSKHRTWKKIHLGFDETTGDVLLGEVTGNDKADGDVLDTLLAQLPKGTIVDQVSADGAYDKRKCYDSLWKRKIPHVAIPPQHNAKIWRHGNTKAERHARDENLRRILERSARNNGRSKGIIIAGVCPKPACSASRLSSVIACPRGLMKDKELWITKCRIVKSI